MPKILLAVVSVVSVIIVFGLGYWFYGSIITPEQETEQETKHEIVLVLEELEQETGIDFSEIEQTEFKWVIKVDPKVEEVDIEGKGFEVKEISSEQFDSIYSFFKDKGFEIDLYNIADGTISGLRGYKKDKVACVVFGGLTGYKQAQGQWVAPEFDKWDVIIKCSKLEKTEKDKTGEACINSGGEITTSLCCKSANDYPNLCLIGACGCSPDNSHQIKVCDCGQGKCFNGSACIVLE